MPFYAEAVLSFGELQIGYVQSAYYAANAFGLFVLLPRALFVLVSPALAPPARRAPSRP